MLSNIVSRLFARVVICSLLASCGTTTETRSVADLSGIRTIGVISALGPDISFTRQGITAFGNEQVVLASNASIDEQIAEKVSEILSPKFEGSRVSVDKANLALPSHDRITFKFLAQDSYEKRMKRISNTLATLPPMPDTDSFLVISKIRLPASSYYRSEIEGLGIFRMRGLEAPHAIYVIDLISAKTGAPIVSGSGELAKPSKPDIFGDRPVVARLAGPLNDVELKYPYEADEYTELKKEELLQEISALLDQSLRDTLTTMKLVP